MREQLVTQCTIGRGLPWYIEAPYSLTTRAVDACQSSGPAVQTNYKTVNLKPIIAYVTDHTIPYHVGNAIKDKGYGIESINTTRHTTVTLL